MGAFRAGILFRAAAVVAGAAAWSACVRPPAEEAFVRADRADAEGGYVFEADMSDSLCRYDWEFYVVLACNDRDYAAFGGAEFRLRLQSPSGENYGETVFFGREDLAGGNFFEKHFRLRYRENTTPVEFGLWKVRVFLHLPEGGGCVPGGVGFRLTRKERWDTEN